MKCLLSWLVLMVSIAVLVSSCAKSDDSSTSSTDNTTSSSANPEVFVATGGNGDILRSTDNGSSFSSPLNLSGVNHLTDVSFGNHTFVGVSSVSGVIIRSTDNGTTWASVTSGTTESLRGVAF